MKNNQIVTLKAEDGNDCKAVVIAAGEAGDRVQIRIPAPLPDWVSAAIRRRGIFYGERVPLDMTLFRASDGWWIWTQTMERFSIE